jgi:hypothetical protein
MKKYIILLLMLPLMAMKCEKDKDPLAVECNDDLTCELAKLPPLTTEGKGTFGCLVNGKAWLPHGFQTWGGGAPDYRSLFYVEDKHYFLSANYTENQEFVSSVGVRIDDFNSVGNYPLYEYSIDRSYGFYRDYEAIENSIVYYTDSLSDPLTNKVTVTLFDPENQIISGTFEFTGTAENGDTVHISHGRFDVPFVYQ